MASPSPGVPSPTKASAPSAQYASPTRPSPIDEMLIALLVFVVLVGVGKLATVYFPETFGDLQEWTILVLGRTITTMTGGVSLLIGLIEHYRGKVSSRVWISIALCCLITSSFLTWHERKAIEAKEAADFKKQIQEGAAIIGHLHEETDRMVADRSPNFTISLLNTLVYSPWSGSKGRRIVFIVSVENKGADSAATISAHLFTPDKPSMSVPMLIDKPADTEQVYFHHRPMYAFHTSDFLPDILASRITKYVPRTGYLSYFVEDKKLLDGQYQLLFTLKDASGNYVNSKMYDFWATVSDGNFYYEGTRLNETHVDPLHQTAPASPPQ